MCIYTYLFDEEFKETSEEIKINIGNSSCNSNTKKLAIIENKNLFVYDKRRKNVEDMLRAYTLYMLVFIVETTKQPLTH